MPVLDFPTSVKINAMDFGIVTKTQNFTSELNGTTQTVALPGSRWTATLNFTNKTGAEARTLMAFLSKLRGRAGRFRLRLPTKVSQRSGDANSGCTVQAVNTDGSLLVGGITETPATADSTILTTDATYPINNTAVIKPGVIRAGDYITVNDELKIVTDDTAYGTEGTVNVYIQPPQRSAPVGTPVVLDDVTCIMQLTDDGQSKWGIQPLPIYAMTVSAIEAADI